MSSTRFDLRVRRLRRATKQQRAAHEWMYVCMRAHLYQISRDMYQPTREYIVKELFSIAS